ncbi:MAG: hypothetical protein ACYTFY_16250 [Planctomycetota bacterium]
MKKSEKYIKNWALDFLHIKTHLQSSMNSYVSIETFGCTSLFDQELIRIVDILIVRGTFDTDFDSDFDFEVFRTLLKICANLRLKLSSFLHDLQVVHGKNGLRAMPALSFPWLISYIFHCFYDFSLTMPHK